MEKLLLTCSHQQWCNDPEPAVAFVVHVQRRWVAYNPKMELSLTEDEVPSVFFINLPVESLPIEGGNCALLERQSWRDADVSSSNAAFRAAVFQRPSTGSPPWENSGGIDCADNAPALVAGQEAANVSLLIWRLARLFIAEPTSSKQCGFISREAYEAGGRRRGAEGHDCLFELMALCSSEGKRGKNYKSCVIKMGCVYCAPSFSSGRWGSSYSLNQCCCH